MLREQRYDPQMYIWDELKEVFNLIDKGHFSGGTKETFRPIIDNLAYYDPFLYWQTYLITLQLMKM